MSWVISDGLGDYSGETDSSKYEYPSAFTSRATHFLTVPGGLEEMCCAELQENGYEVERATQGKVFFFCERRSEHERLDIQPLSLAERLFGFLDCVPLCHSIRSPHTCRTFLWDRVHKFRAGAFFAAVAQHTGRHLCDATETSTLSYRVSCKLSECYSNQISHLEVSKCVGTAFRRRFSFLRPNLRSADIEIFVHLQTDELVIGLTLCTKPLSLRSYIAVPGTRCNVAMAMCRLAQIGQADVVLDPCCGTATILMEAACRLDPRLCIGIDRDVEQLASAKRNLMAHAAGQRVSVLHGDCTQLPLAAQRVSRIVCDLPFGRRFSAGTSVAGFYGSCLAECARVVQDDGVAALLVQDRALLAKALEACRGWSHQQTVTIRIGGLAMHIVVLRWQVSPADATYEVGRASIDSDQAGLLRTKHFDESLQAVTEAGKRSRLQEAEQCKPRTRARQPKNESTLGFRVVLTANDSE